MNSKLSIINPVTYPEWDRLILKNSSYSVFHSQAWVKVLNETYNYTPHFFVSFDKSNIESLIPFIVVNSWLTGKRAISLPFSDFCPLILNSNYSFHYFLKYIKKIGIQKNWKYLEFRGLNSLGKNIPFSELFYEHELLLRKDQSDILSGFHATTKRNIANAKKKGIQIKISYSYDSIKEYYRLHCITRKRLGVPPQPMRFFHNLYYHLIKDKQGFIVLASNHNKNIAGLIFLHFGKMAIFKFGASDHKYQKFRPTNLAMWEGIKKCLRVGVERLSFGRTDIKNQGLRRFKNGWNTNEKILCYYRYDIVNDKFQTSKRQSPEILNKVLQKVPVNMLKIIGEIFYRHVG